MRTFNARRGRTRPGTVRRLVDHADLLVPDGPIDPAGTFGRVAPLVLEVGSGQGGAALAYAAAHPGHDLLAVDVYTPGISRLVGAVAGAGLTNVLAVVSDALDLLARLPPGSLAAVHLFFPDPWAKARHHKRRFVRPDVADLVVDRLTPHGCWLVATDDTGYAGHAASVLDAHPDLTGGAAERPWWRPATGFEQRAVEAGRTVAELAYRRRA